MKVNIILHRSSDLMDLEEQIRKGIEGKVEPLDLNITWVETCFDILEGIDDSAHLNIVFLAPKRGMEPLLTPVMDRLLDRGVKIFFAWYDDAPSMVEDFQSYVLRLLGVPGKE